MADIPAGTPAAVSLPTWPAAASHLSHTGLADGGSGVGAGAESPRLCVSNRSPRRLLCGKRRTVGGAVASRRPFRFQIGPFSDRPAVQASTCSRGEHFRLGAPLAPPAPKKGLITDSDDTLWNGIVGEIGPENVSWDLASHHQVHGLYQMLLAALAEEGVLIGVASKNAPAVVKERERGRPLQCGSSQARAFTCTTRLGGKAGRDARLEVHPRGRGKRARQKRLRHLLTIWRGVSSRKAITSLERPWEASRMILARMTSQYGDVYWRAIDPARC